MVDFKIALESKKEDLELDDQTIKKIQEQIEKEKQEFNEKINLS